MSAPTPSAVWSTGTTVDGRYRVLGELGRGGMGVVHRVRHLAWGIDMAVKSSRPEVFRGLGDRELFVREAEAWVSLGLHPNICACHYVRVIAGVPRVFAEYVDGGSLAEWIGDGRLYAGDARQVLARVLDTAVQAARGLEHAHRRELVHQDVKPANILLDGAGAAKITDFGLARSMAAVASTMSETAPGASVLVPWGGMTVGYASPEQLAGERVGRRSDVYSFAVTVLEMFTGGVRWSAGSVAGLALEEYLVDPTNAVAAPPEVAHLLRRCLRQHPADRPPSMADIADVLTGIYEQQTGSTYPRPAPQEADLRADELNNRGLSLLDLDRAADAEQAFDQALAVDPHHVGAVYNGGLLRWRTGAITDAELVTRLEAIPQGSDASAWQADLLLARVHLERGDLAAAHGLLDALARERPDGADVRAALRVATSGSVTDARRTGTRPVREPFALPGAPVKLLARHEVMGYLPIRFTPDGRLAVSGHWDGVIRLWDTATGAQRMALKGQRTQVLGVDLTPDGSYALSTSRGGTVQFWDLRAGRCSQAIHAVAHATGCPVSLSADGRIGVWKGADGRVQVWEPGTGTCRWLLGPAIKDGALDGSLYEVSADGRHVLTAENDGARLWSVADGLCRVLAAGSRTHALCFSPDGRLAAIAGQDRVIRLWDVEDGRQVRTLTGDTAAAGHLAFSHDGRRLLSGTTGDHTVRLWELDSGRCLRTFSAHAYGMHHVGFRDTDARFGCSVGGHPELPLHHWRLPDAGYVAEPHVSKPREYAEVSRLGGLAEELIADARRALSNGRHRSALDLLTRARAIPGYERAPQVLAAWHELGRSARHVGLRAAWSQPLDAGPRPFGGITAIGVAAGARLAVSGQSDGTIRIWDLDRGTCTRVLDDHRGRVGEVALSDDGRHVLCKATKPLAITRWRLADGERRQVTPDWDMTRTVLFTGDGRHAWFGGGDGVIRRWDLDDDRCVATIGSRGAVNVISTSTDGRLAAVGDSNGVVRLWDLDTGTCLRTWTGPREPILSACLSADGRLALSTHLVTSSGGQNEPIRLWDAGTERCLRTFEGHEGWSSAVRFTPDARFAFSAAHDRTIRLWEVATGRCLHVLEGHQGYIRHLELTPDTRNLVSAGDDGIRLWHLDWELATDATQRDEK